jgi:hypothetical protein
MPAAVRYHIPDEPAPSGLAHLVVDPIWPLLAQMLAGSWLALPWFVFNAFALGSPTRGREIGLATASLFGAAAFEFGVIMFYPREDLPMLGMRVLMLGTLCIKLWLAYALAIRQTAVFELFRHFGGKGRNGLVVLLLGAFVARPWLAEHMHWYFRDVLL